MSTDRPLEFDLVDALLANDLAQARAIAQRLHQRGIDYTTIQAALAAHPHLEDQLWDVLREVIPLARRAAKRRAIRAAEERDWGDWEAGKKKL